PRATLCVRVQPWLLDGRAQAVLTTRDGLMLSVGEGGAVLEIGGARCQVAAPMLERRWYELRVILDAGRARLLQIPLRRVWGIADAGEAAMDGGIDAIEAMLFAAAFADPYDRFLNGRIEDPMILRGIHDGAEPLEPSAQVIAWWDFSADIATQRLTDRGPHGLDGRLRNLPTRAVRGSRWSGAAMDWHDRPRDYAATHFHEDDLYDCEWATDFTFEVPPDMPSGVYGIRLRGDGEQDILPVYVLPPRGTTRAPVAFLASTFTYQVYGNHARGNANASYRARRAEWNAYPHNPDEHPEYGRSTYNKHVDGSGFCYSSTRRPLLTMRPGFLTFLDRRGSGLRHFAADTHLTDWLEARHIAFDVITDHDLDREKLDLLRGYKTVLTGSHPEYHTPNTLNALQDYVGGGGRLVYLGGNGFYWRIANSAAVPEVLELRRAEGAPTRVRGRMAASEQPGLGVTPIMPALGAPVLSFG
ncbi:MAG: N,N-dimethylformamidase beta subunit family domain-containing protein, partial [Acetobacteraceae bacterium]